MNAKIGWVSDIRIYFRIDSDVFYFEIKIGLFFQDVENYLGKEEQLQKSSIDAEELDSIRVFRSFLSQ